MPKGKSNHAADAISQAYGFARRQASDIKTAVKKFNVVGTASRKMGEALDKAKAKAKR